MKTEVVICAIDIGTSEIRASLFSSELIEKLASTRTRNGSKSGVEIDAEQLWLDVVEVLKDLFSRNEKFEIGLISVTSQIGQLLLDTDSRQLGIGGGWADTRGREELSNIAANIPNFKNIVGRSHFTGGGLPLLLWYKERYPVEFKKVVKVVTPKDYINFKLTNVFSTDPTSAAYSYAFNISSATYDQRILQEIGLTSDYFPTVKDAIEVVGFLTKETSEICGIPVGIPVITGGPDGTLGALALIGKSDDKLACISGSTDVYFRISLAKSMPTSTVVTVNPYLVSGLWGLGGSTGMSGSAIAYWDSLVSPIKKSLFLNNGDENFDNLLPGSNGLIISNYLSGSRFPDWDPDEVGAVWGLKSTHSSSHFARAIRESTAYGARQSIEKIEEGSNQNLSLLIGGGLVKDVAALQIRSDVLGREIFVCEIPNLSLLGAAILASVGIGWFTDFSYAQESLKLTFKKYVPNIKNKETYDHLFGEWLKLRAMSRQARKSASAR